MQERFGGLAFAWPSPAMRFALTCSAENLLLAREELFSCS